MIKTAGKGIFYSLVQPGFIVYHPSFYTLVFRTEVDLQDLEAGQSRTALGMWLNLGERRSRAFAIVFSGR
jgi:hypothetical protein